MKRFKQGKRILGVIVAAAIAVSSNTTVFADELGENVLPQNDVVSENQDTGAIKIKAEPESGKKENQEPKSEGKIRETEREDLITEIPESQEKNFQKTETEETEVQETEQIIENESEAGIKGAAKKSLYGDQKISEELNLNDWDYEIKDSNIILQKYKGNNVDVVIPSKVNIQGKEFQVKLAKSVGIFSDNEIIKSVVFQDGISVEDNDMSNAFQRCSNLESVSGIPDSVTKMKDTFLFCSQLIKVEKLPADLKDMAGIFYGCTSLAESPAIPDGVTNLIGSFSRCESLKKGPELPKGITDITSIYEGCTSLTETAPIPNTVKIMKQAFKGCKSLIQIESLPEQLENMDEAFQNCEKLVRVADIPKGVTQLNTSFFDCTSLRQMPTLPNGLKSMYSTFGGCSSLVSSVSIPDSVTEMNYTFMNCIELLKSPQLPSGLISMSGLFEGCKKIENPPKIPDSVVNMYRSFSGCLSLKKAPALPPKVQNLGFAFESCIKITKAPNIPESVVNLGWAFSSCINLKGSVTIYASLTKMIDDSIAGRHLAYTGCFDSAASNSTGLIINYGPKCKNINEVVEYGAYNNKKVKKGQLVLQVKFKANGGTTEKSYKNVYHNKKYGKLPTPKRAKYTFSGWYTKKSGGTKITSSSKITAKKNITLYAHWKKVNVGKVSSVSLKNTKSKRMTVHTKAVSGAKGYLITYAGNASFTKDKKSLFTSYTKKNINKLQKNKKYFVKVRAYKLDSTGKKIYGKYSSVKKIKITK